MKLVAEAWLDCLPPSANNAYENKMVRGKGGKVVGGGRRLTEEGRQFKTEATNTLARALSSVKIEPNKPYLIDFTFYFLPSQLFNKGYPKKTKNRYKRVDTLNRGKLLEDALADALGLDDAHNFRICLEKRPGDTQVTAVEIYEMEDEWTQLGLG